MSAFVYRDGVLHAEDLDLGRLAANEGTPFYCYSAAALRGNFRRFAAPFEGLDPLIAYSAKANSNLAVLRVFAAEGAGADVVSGGEVLRARRAGVPAERIVFSGVGKTRKEMALALGEGVHQFNVESDGELEALAALARSKATRAPVGLRVNPDVAAGGHEKISTGKARDKFGVPIETARALYARASTLSGIATKGLAVHIGSQILSLRPFEDAFVKMASLVRALRADGLDVERLDLGGGLGVAYAPGDDAPSVEDYAALIRRVLAPLGVSLIVEPGRAIAADAGVLVCRVLYAKEGVRPILVLDAGMNDFLRPALYDAHHELIPLRAPRPDAALRRYDVVGPVCESGDVFARARTLPELKAGDLVAFRGVGAYGAVLSSSYNSRPLVPEILVDGARYAVVRRRPSFAESIALEATPEWLQRHAEA